MHIAKPRGIVPLYDTIPNVVATVYDTAKKLQKSAPVTWAIRTPNVVTIAGTDPIGHHVVIIAIGVGTTYVVASATINGSVVVDSNKITVTKPKAKTVSVYWAVHRVPGSTAIVGDSSGTIAENGQKCAYVVDWDKMGHPVTGQSFGLASSDPSVMHIYKKTVVAWRMQPPGWVSAVCPDTTIDPFKIAVP